MWKWSKKHYQLLISLAVSGVLVWLWFPDVWKEQVSLVAPLTGQEFYRAIGKGAAILAILQFGLATWVKVRIDESVKHEYAKKLEDYRNDLKIREQAAGIAKLLAHVRAADNVEDPEFLKIAWELSLWLPPEIFTELNKRACGLGSDDDVKAILLQTRKLLLGEKAEELNPDDIPPFVKRVD